MKYGAEKLVPFIFIANLFAGEVLPPELIEGLGADDFSVRETSQKNLLAWAKGKGKSPAPQLFRISQESDDPEVRQRCVEVLRGLSDVDYLSDGKGFLGIVMEEIITDVPQDDKPRAAVVIKMVVNGSPAERSGLHVGDMIVALDKELWRDPGALIHFRDSISAKKPLDEVVLSVKRGNGNLEDVKVTLGRSPLQDIPNAMGDLQLLDEMARERHFKEWLGEQKLQAE